MAVRVKRGPLQGTKVGHIHVRRAPGSASAVEFRITDCAALPQPALREYYREHGTNATIMPTSVTASDLGTVRYMIRNGVIAAAIDGILDWRLSQ